MNQAKPPSREDFKKKLAHLRKVMEREEFDLCLNRFYQKLKPLLENLTLYQSHKVVLAEHLPRYDASKLAIYANKRSQDSGEGWVFAAMPEAQITDDDGVEQRQQLTGLYEVVTTF